MNPGARFRFELIASSDDMVMSGPRIKKFEDLLRFLSQGWSRWFWNPPAESIIGTIRGVRGRGVGGLITPIKDLVRVCQSLFTASGGHFS